MSLKIVDKLDELPDLVMLRQCVLVEYHLRVVYHVMQLKVNWIVCLPAIHAQGVSNEVRLPCW